MQTLRDLEELLRRSDVGCVTLNAAANGKFYTTVHFRTPDNQFRTENRWSDTLAEGLLLGDEDLLI